LNSQCGDFWKLSLKLEKEGFLVERLDDKGSPVG
jgi:hypothetical protein